MKACSSKVALTLKTSWPSLCYLAVCVENPQPNILHDRMHRLKIYQAHCLTNLHLHSTILSSAQILLQMYTIYIDSAFSPDYGKNVKVWVDSSHVYQNNAYPHLMLTGPMQSMKGLTVHKPGRGHSSSCCLNDNLGLRRLEPLPISDIEGWGYKAPGGICQTWTARPFRSQNWKASDNLVVRLKDWAKTPKASKFQTRARQSNLVQLAHSRIWKLFPTKDSRRHGASPSSPDHKQGM